MKKLNISLLGLCTFTGLAYGGGDILDPVFEHEEVIVPVEVYVPPSLPKAISVPIPAPVVIPKVVPVPVVPIVNDILPLGLYVGLGLSGARFDPSCPCPSPKGDVDKTAGVIGRVGYDFNKYIGLETRGIRTNWKSNGGKIKHAGLFVKPMYPVSKDINLYALGGYAKTTTEGSKRRIDVESLAWGAGLEYDFANDTPKDGKYSRTFDGYGDQEAGWGLFADYERLVQKSGSPDLDTVNIGITYDF